MPLQLIQALVFPFRLAVADSDERQYRRNIQHRQCIGVLRRDFARRNQRTEDAGMIRQHPLHIPSGVQRGQLWRAELFQGHHAAETADGIIMEGIFEDLPHLFRTPANRDLRRYGMRRHPAQTSFQRCALIHRSRNCICSPVWNQCSPPGITVRSA